NTEQLYHHLPLATAPTVGRFAPYYLDWVERDRYDDYWKSVAPKEFYHQVMVPAFNIGGWYDLFLAGTCRNFIGMSQRGGSTQARTLQRLTIGPWAHGVYGGHFPEHSFGVKADVNHFDLTGAQLRWFDHSLRGIENGADKDPSVRVFVMGANRWQEFDSWPPPNSELLRLYLHSRGRANSNSGDGVLSQMLPSDEPSDSFDYDPALPVPTVGGATFLPGLHVGANSGPRDQRQVELRPDVLCYTTDPLQTPIDAIGPVGVVLHASSSAVDTDFTAKLVDVWPDGRTKNVVDGIIRLRYRESLAQPTDAEPGVIYQVRIDLSHTAYHFAAGHRIRLDISSSNFPKYDRNSCGLSKAAAVTGTLPITHNSVFHTKGQPSFLELSVASA
ncbi:MAG: CocE/NonD family hydrolase, partial [Propionibacteriaceae bacterium]|nr:CocE/NonD family hydrolase [Propionibacteriaceae bacterium]